MMASNIERIMMILVGEFCDGLPPPAAQYRVSVITSFNPSEFLVVSFLRFQKFPNHFHLQWSANSMSPRCMTNM